MWQQSDLCGSPRRPAQVQYAKQKRVGGIRTVEESSRSHEAAHVLNKAEREYRAAVLAPREDV
jgi:hypothetical protein